MKKIGKKSLALALTLAMALSLLCVTPLALGSTENAAAPLASVIFSGSCGNDVNYALEEDGTMYISGSGAMTDYGSADDVPWSGLCSLITSVVIEEGVTTVGDYAFKNCSNLESVSFADGLETIGKEAFRYCTNLQEKTVIFPASLTSIGQYAFELGESMAGPMADQREYPTLTLVFLGERPTTNYAFSNMNVTVYYPYNTGNWNSWMERVLKGEVTAGSFGAHEVTYIAYNVCEHEMLYHPAQSVTCTENSYSAYWECTECGHYFSDENGENEIVKDSWITGNFPYGMGHYFSDEKDGNGNYRYIDFVFEMNSAEAVVCKACFTCKTCGEVIEKNAEIASGGSITKQPTCEESGEFEGSVSVTSDPTWQNNYYTGETTVTAEASGTFEISPLGHELEVTSARNPSCVSEGNIAYWHCSVCSKYFSDANGKTEINLEDTVIPATGEHTIAENSITVTEEPTCEGEGEMTYVCTVCRGTYTGAVPAAGHRYDENDAVIFNWSEENDAITCTATFTCAECNKQTEVDCSIAQIGTTTATCTEPGEATLQATAAIDSRGTEVSASDTKGNVAVSALGHSWGETVWGDWTEDAETGRSISASRTCTREGCGETEYADVTVTSETTLPTCGREGKTVYTAAAIFSDATDETSKTEELPATGEHIWDEGVITLAPTCVTEGEMTYTCTVCGATGTGILPAQGHALQYVEAVAATENAPGNIEYWYCENCGALFADAEGTLEITENDIVIPQLYSVTAQSNIEGVEVKVSVNGDITLSEQYILDIRDVNDSVSSEEREAIAQAVATIPDAAGMSMEYYFLEMNLFELLDEEVIQITDSDFSIEITVSIPEDLLNANEYFVVRLHGEENDATVLEPFLDTENNTLTFISDQFSTYAIVALSAPDTESTETTDPEADEPDDSSGTTDEDPDESELDGTGTENPSDENTGDRDSSTTREDGADGDTGTDDTDDPDAAIEIDKENESTGTSNGGSGVGTESNAGTSGGSNVSSGDDDSGKENPDTSDAQMPFMILIVFILSVMTLALLAGFGLRKRERR